MGHGDHNRVERRGQRRGDAKAPHTPVGRRALKGHHHHKRRADIQQQVGHAHGGPVVHQLRFSRQKTDGSHEKQLQDALSHSEE